MEKKSIETDQNHSRKSRTDSLETLTYEVEKSWSMRTDGRDTRSIPMAHTTLQIIKISLPVSINEAILEI